MATELACTTCSSPADLVCSCVNVYVCKACTGPHISKNFLRVHTFLPIASQDLSSSDGDNYLSFRKANMEQSFKTMISGTLTEIDGFRHQLQKGSMPKPIR